jgi:hypothetical protein
LQNARDKKGLKNYLKVIVILPKFLVKTNCFIRVDYKRHLPRRQPRRLKGYNYAKAGTYFVTLNCKLRFPFFGEIKEGKMILNEFGTIVQNEWVRTPEIRPNISLGPFIVMPDHLHGIIIIEKEIKVASFSNKAPDIDFGKDPLIISPTQTEVRLDIVDPNFNKW